MKTLDLNRALKLEDAIRFFSNPESEHKEVFRLTDRNGKTHYMSDQLKNSLHKYRTSYTELMNVINVMRTCNDVDFQIEHNTK